MAAPTILTRRLTKQYGDTKVVNALDLRLSAGEVFGLLGPERSWQNHHDSDVAGSGRTDLRRHRGSRTRPGPQPIGGQEPRRLPAGCRRVLRRPDRA